MPIKRVQREKIKKEIKRLQNMLSFSKLDTDERLYIEKQIEYHQNEIGYIK